MNKSVIEQLRESLESWEVSVKLRNEARNSAKLFVKQKEKELKDSKRVLYLITKDWNEARKNVKKAKSRLSVYPYKTRKWAKEHIGKVIDNLGEMQ